VRAGALAPVWPRLVLAIVKSQISALLPSRLKVPLHRLRGRARSLWAQKRGPQSVWFWDHYEQAALEIIYSVGQAGVTLRDKVVADIGSGDGIMALGVANRGRPARLVGFDIVRTDVDHLSKRAREEGVRRTMPAELSFVQSIPERLPAVEGEFDVAYTWSAFEHIQNPLAVLKETRRILKQDGVLFLQLWPFYYSDRGSHLWDWFPEPFHHLSESSDKIVDAMRHSSVADEAWTEYMIREFESLNRITLDDLQDALVAAEFDVVRLELLTQIVAIPRHLARSVRLTNLAIGGVKLLAVPRP